MLENEILSSRDNNNEWGPSREERVLGAICYGPFGFIVPILLQKQSEFLAFHTRQGGIIFMAWLILNLVPTGLFGLLTLAYIGLAGFVGWKAYNGEKYVYPFIQTILDQFKK